IRASISFFLPAPSTIVVFSFEMVTFLARPSICSVTVSSLMPRSSEIAWPPVRTAMSCSIALRRSPKPGAFTAATFRPPRSLLTTSVARATLVVNKLRGGLKVAAQLVDDERGESLAFHVLGDDQQRLAGLHHRFEQREQLLQARQLLLVDEDVGIVELDPHLVGVGDEVGRDVAAVELHALDHLELGLERLCLF